MLAEGVAPPQGHTRDESMNSVSYRHKWCELCKPQRYAFTHPRAGLFATNWVRTWVLHKVVPSRYIWELAKGCEGCAQVYIDKTRVLGNLLSLLVIKVL